MVLRRTGRVRLGGEGDAARTRVALVSAVLLSGTLALAGCASGQPESAAAVRPVSSAVAAPGTVAISSASVPALSAAWPYYGTRMDPPLPKPDFALVDTSGARYDIPRRTSGRITVLFFGYTHCPDECPTTMANISAALHESPTSISDRVTVLFVTVDPARDTGPVLRSWLDRFDPRFVGLTATGGATAAQAAIEADAGSLGVPVENPSQDTDGSTSVGHGTESLVYGTDGTARLFWTPDTTVLQIEHDLRQLVS